MRLLFSIVLLAAILSAAAQERRVTNAKLAAIGYCAMQDTYLSPEQYTGPEFRYISHTLRERDSTRWCRLIVNEGAFAVGESRSKNGCMLSGEYHFQYGVMRRWTLLDGRLRIRGGAQGEFFGGFLYNTRNGNNPAQARAAINIGPVARAEYRLGRCLLAYEASCPLLGLTFSPAFGQSYYEIFNEGHYDHNCVPTTVVATPSLRQTLTADVRLLGITWRIGYLGAYRQQQVNHLKQHLYTSSLVIGVVKTFTVNK